MRCRGCKCVCSGSVMLAHCHWRRSKSVWPTSPGEKASDNSRAHAFLITAPLSHTPKSTLRSTNTSRSFALPGLRLSYQNPGAVVYLNREVVVILRPGLVQISNEMKRFHSMLCVSAATQRFGDQSTAATWSRGLQGSRTAGPCRSLTPWRATWGRDAERRRLSSATTKPSAPSPRFQGALVHADQMFQPSLTNFSWVVAVGGGVKVKYVDSETAAYCIYSLFFWAFD